MADLLGSCEAFLQIALELWADNAAQRRMEHVSVRQQEEATAVMRARLASCVTKLQRLHEIDARRDLLRASPAFEGRERCLQRLEQIRKDVLRSVRKTQ